MKILSLLLLSLTLSLSNAHKFYMSTTDIKFNEGSKTLQLTVKLFTDDLEKVLNEESGSKTFLGSSKENESVESVLKSYILDHIKLSTKNDTIILSYLGREVEQDYTWVYLESNKISSPKRIEIRNSLLIDYFEEQTNKVNFINGKINNSNSFHKNKIEGFIPQ